MDKYTKIRLSKQVMLISGIFCLVVSVLLIANFWQLNKSDPLESKTMEALVQRLAAEPGNEELREEIRRFDLLARKAYFTSSWQVRTGALLLLFGGVVFVLALKINSDLQQKITPPEETREHPLEARFITHRWLLASGTILIILAFFAAFTTSDQLQNYLLTTHTGANPATGSEEIELITISEQTSSDIETTGAAEVGSPGEVNNSLAIQETNEKKNAEASSIKYYGIDSFKKNQATFRGFFGHGISYHKDIPVDWDGTSGKNIKWKVALPKQGYNSPVIWEDKIFVAGADSQSSLVICFDINSGRLLWEKEVSDIPGSPSTPPEVTDDTGLSAPTMAVDGNHVYAIFATGNIIAFDLEGNRKWARNLGVPENHYGHSSSLMVWKDRLVVQYDTGKGGRMMALNTNSGETIWDISRDNQISWSSPILLQKDENIQIITTADPFVAGYNLTDGRELWKVDALMGEVAPSAAYSNGLVFATNEYARTVAVKPGPGSEIIWEDNYYLSEVSSPVAYREFLFLATSYGDLVCHDAQTGNLHWEHHFNNGFYSSPMVADDRIYIIDMEGVMHIVQADASGEIINEPELGEKAFAVPAFSDERIYIRSNEALYCIEEE